MPDIVFPTSSSPGVKPQEGGGRLVNAFAEKTPAGAPSDIITIRSCGIRQVTETLAHSHTRGFLDCGSTLIWLLTNRAYAVSVSGSTFTIVNLGELLGSTPVTTARNNNATPQNVVVSDGSVFNLFTASAPTAFADLDLPGSPTSVTDLDGYFLFTYGDGRIFASDLNSVSVSALSNTTEQGLFIRRGVRFAGRFFAFGDKWTGVYRDVGSSPFPLGREVTIPRGIIGTHAIAGWETGWANELLWVGDDFIVYKLSGYTPVPVSTPDVSRAIQTAALSGAGSTLQAFVYMFGRNAFWVLTYPDNWTWEFNLSTGEWNERSSHDRLDWKARRSVRTFSRWLIGDDLTGKLYETSGDYFQDGLDPLVWLVESGVVSGFPIGMSIPRASFAMTTGVGDIATHLDPQVQISWSLDGGHTYGYPVLRSLGEPGQTRSHPYVLNGGLSRGQGVRYRLKVSDPVHVGLSGGKIDVEQRGPSG